jgi:hypothetical protein
LKWNLSFIPINDKKLIIGPGELIKHIAQWLPLIYNYEISNGVIGEKGDKSTLTLLPTCSFRLVASNFSSQKTQNFLHVNQFICYDVVFALIIFTWHGQAWKLWKWVDLHFVRKTKIMEIAGHTSCATVSKSYRQKDWLLRIVHVQINMVNTLVILQGPRRWDWVMLRGL